MTPQQRKALHLYCQQLSDALNNAGLDMKKTLKPEIDIPWTMESIKTHIWKPIQEAALGKTSTTELDNTDPSLIYETINRFMAEKHGIHIYWPDRNRNDLITNLRE